MAKHLSISFFAMVLSLILVIAIDGFAADRADDSTADQQAAITKTAQAFIEAFQKGDATAIAAFWTPDGDYVDLGGRVIKGRKAITEDFADLFTEHKGLTLRIEVASVRFPTPDIAIEDGVTSVLSPDGELPNRARYTNVLVKKDGEWLIASVREAAYVPPNNYEQLRPLEWVIGEWVEDTKESHVGRVLFEWTADQNFIIGTLAVGVKDILLDNGSQRIGWDPAAKLIRSWNFESDGGFSHGAWKKDGDNWIITMSSVLRSGSLMTGTIIVTRVDPDTITWQLKDQQLDGKAIPDTPVIKMKRVK
jgi:uncharacterized protein (TIGR02246 family)